MKESDSDLGFYQIPAFIMLDKDLSPIEKLFLAVLNRRKHQKGYCFASNSHLIEVLNISLRTLTTMLTSLEKREYIVREMVYREGTKEVEQRKIFLTEKSEFATPMAKIAHTPTQELHEGYGNNCIEPIAKVAQDNIQVNKEINKEVKEEEERAVAVATPTPPAVVSKSIASDQSVTTVLKQARKKSCPDVLVTDDEFEKLKNQHYQTDLLDHKDLADAFLALQTYAVNEPKKFKKYKSHYLVLIGWVKDKVMQSKKAALALARETSYLESSLERR